VLRHAVVVSHLVAACTPLPSAPPAAAPECQCACTSPPAAVPETSTLTVTTTPRDALVRVDGRAIAGPVEVPRGQTVRVQVLAPDHITKDELFNVDGPTALT